MNQQELLEEKYEEVEGKIRKVAELVAQLELWSDEYTINHKKEETRLVEYVGLHKNLKEFKNELQLFLDVNKDELSDRLPSYTNQIEERLESYKETEQTIHAWIRAIKNIHLMIARSEVLEEERDFLEGILN